jgi:hypothetical protein
VVHFSTIEYTSAVRDLPHSKQHAFNREVINPHDGHILCVPYPAICGFSLRILRSSRIVNRAISRPKEILVAFIETTLLDEFRIERSNDLMAGGHAPADCRLHSRSAWGLWPPAALLIPWRYCERFPQSL